ncbi:MAG: glutathione peroxidase [Bacteroidales bacterium]|nr:glutathione peroxidase [Bacteroidales bacterium]
MLRTILLAAGLIFTLAITAQNDKSFYDFTVNTITGEAFSLSQLKGQKVLVVNTASKCGMTPQYKELQELHETYGNKNFTIIGFPANNFMNQEPGSNEEIAEFCETNYGVTFLMMEKISVKGKDIHPLYQWLTQKSQNGKMDAEVSWNFQKFMIDENGQLFDVATPREKPMSDKIVSWITE